MSLAWGSVHTLTPSDADELVRLHRASFAPIEVSTTIFSAPGIAEYYRDILGRACDRHEIFGVKQAGSLLAYAHVVQSATESHLNHIAVKPGQRGNGIGTLLLRRWVQGLRGRRTCTLHVRDDNVGARRLYEAHGFSTISTADWWSAACAQFLDADRTPGTARIDLVEAENWKKYGFCKIEVDCGERRYQAGVLGTHWYRIDKAFSIDACRAISRHPSATGRALLVRGGALSRTSDARTLYTSVLMRRERA